MEGSLASSGDVSGDTVAWSGRLKPFLSYRTRYSALSSVKEHSGSNCSLASITGSTQNLLDPTKLMTLQDDARCRRISSEVMKRCLYKSDVPSRRRAYGRLHSGSSRARMAQSMPVTPAQSHTVSPAHSPTSMTGSYYAFLSRGTTPRAVTPELEDGDEDDNGRCDAGIASVLRPQPRYVRALPPRLDEVADETDDTLSDGIRVSAFETTAKSSYGFRSLNVVPTQNALS